MVLKTSKWRHPALFEGDIVNPAGARSRQTPTAPVRRRLRVKVAATIFSGLVWSGDLSAGGSPAVPNGSICAEGRAPSSCPVPRIVEADDGGLFDAGDTSARGSRAVPHRAYRPFVGVLPRRSSRRCCGDSGTTVLSTAVFCSPTEPRASSHCRSRSSNRWHGHPTWKGTAITAVGLDMMVTRLAAAAERRCGIRWKSSATACRHYRRDVSGFQELPQAMPMFARSFVDRLTCATRSTTTPAPEILR